VSAGHAYAVGAKVVVWNQTLNGRTFCEGRATVRRLCDRDDTYMVAFESEPHCLYERVVELDAADLPLDDPRVAALPVPPVSLSSAIEREIPEA
jgi:hypothetical protein